MARGFLCPSQSPRLHEWENLCPSQSPWIYDWGNIWPMNIWPNVLAWVTLQTSIWGRDDNPTQTWIIQRKYINKLFFRLVLQFKFNFTALSVSIDFIEVYCMGLSDIRTYRTFLWHFSYTCCIFSKRQYRLRLQ